MKIDVFEAKSGKRDIVLALGPESSGNFSVYRKGKIYFFQTGIDLLDENNFFYFQKKINSFLKREKIKPDIILTDLHPRYRTTAWGEELVKKYGAEKAEVQHHLAHVFSSIGDRIVQDTKYKIPDTIIGVACDGTGYGLDGKIWGGEVFKIKNQTLPTSRQESKIKNIVRTGHLENQVLISGDLAVQEPARMLISILSKFLDKDEVYKLLKKYYSKSQFGVLYNQLKQKFNCQETSSTARILDAVSVLLGFSENKRDKKHGSVFALEKNSTRSYKLKPNVIFSSEEKCHVLLTTPLFKYLLKNLGKDKKRLAATAQKYLAEGLYKMVEKNPNTYFSGGMANNRIMSDFFSSRGVYLSKKISRGDAGLSFGQVIYFLFS